MTKRLEISAEEVRLVRQEGESLVSSFEVRGLPAARQDPYWHDGKKLLALAKKLAAYRRASK